MILVLIVRLLLIALTLYVSLFSLWRMFEHEHVDDIPQATDRLIIAALIAVYLARIPSLVDLMSRHSTSPLSLLNPFVGEAHWQVGIIIFLVIFMIALRDTWRDRYALIDIMVVALTVCLAGSQLWAIVSLVLGSLLAGSAIPIGALVTLILSLVAFVILGRLLSYFERQYRAYFWYRYRRSSAQTGFVTAVFCMGAGIIGLIANLYLLPFSVISLPMFLTIWSLVTIVGGFVLLYIRSGRLKKK